MTQAATMTEQARLVAKIISERLEPLLSSGAAGNAHSLCNETANAVLTALQGSATLPSEAMIEVVDAAIYALRSAPDRSDWNKAIYEARCVARKAMRAATPTAPVQDDDAEWTLNDELHSIIWEAGKTAEPLEDYPVVTRTHKSVFNYGRDCATAAIEEAVLKCIASRLSPTPDTGLIEALGCCGENPSPIPADMVGCGRPFTGLTDAYRCTHCDVLFHKNCAEKHFGDDDVLTEEMIVEIERRDALANAAPAQVESNDATKGEG